MDFGQWLNWLDYLGHGSTVLGVLENCNFARGPRPRLAVYRMKFPAFQKTRSWLDFYLFKKTDLDRPRSLITIHADKIELLPFFSMVHLIPVPFFRHSLLLVFIFTLSLSQSDIETKKKVQSILEKNTFQKRKKVIKKHHVLSWITKQAQPISIVC